MQLRKRLQLVKTTSIPPGGDDINDLDDFYVLRKFSSACFVDLSIFQR